MARIILFVLILLICGVASAQKETTKKTAKPVKLKDLREMGLKAEEQGDLTLAENYYTAFLDRVFVEDIMIRRSTLLLERGDTVGFCLDRGSSGIKGGLYTSLCIKKDSMDFEDSNLPIQTYYGTSSVTKQRNKGTGETWHTLYDDKGERTTSFYTLRGDTIYTFTEQPPEFTGGESELYAYLAKTVRYPIADRNAGIQGKVYIKFLIQIDGSIANAHIVRGATGSLNTAALDSVRSMPPWTPGYHQGGPVVFSYILPVNFEVR